MQVLYPFELQEIPALGFTKLSLVFFFRRIFNTRYVARKPNHPFRKVLAIVRYHVRVMLSEGMPKDP